MPTVINTRITVLPVISFIATIVACIVTFPFIAMEENCSASKESLPDALAIAMFCARVCAANGFDAAISSDSMEIWYC